jgi:hypothetical protein
MGEEVQTVYDKAANMHIAVIYPPLAAVEITVTVLKHESASLLPELFLYNFDVDSNAIEFAFGEKMQDIEFKKYVKYTTDPAIHVPPFRIQITHQLSTVNLANFAFAVSYSLQF